MKTINKFPIKKIGQCNIFQEREVLMATAT